VAPSIVSAIACPCSTATRRRPGGLRPGRLDTARQLGQDLVDVVHSYAQLYGGEAGDDEVRWRVGRAAKEVGVGDSMTCGCQKHTDKSTHDSGLRSLRRGAKLFVQAVEVKLRPTTHTPSISNLKNSDISQLRGVAAAFPQSINVESGFDNLNFVRHHGSKLIGENDARGIPHCRVFHADIGTGFCPGPDLLRRLLVGFDMRLEQPLVSRQ
jgi:hypothetical protein